MDHIEKELEAGRAVILPTGDSLWYFRQSFESRGSRLYIRIKT